MRHPYSDLSKEEFAKLPHAMRERILKHLIAIVSDLFDDAGDDVALPIADDDDGPVDAGDIAELRALWGAE